MGVRWVDPYRLTPCPCPPFWVAERTVVLDLPDGSGTIAVTRQGRSLFSLSHAVSVAIHEARTEAERQLAEPI